MSNISEEIDLSVKITNGWIEEVKRRDAEILDLNYKLEKANDVIRKVDKLIQGEVLTWLQYFRDIDGQIKSERTNTNIGNAYDMTKKYLKEL